jgi:hypothetical protein
MNQMRINFGRRTCIRRDKLVLILTLSGLLVLVPVQHAYSVNASFGSQILLSNSVNVSQNHGIAFSGTDVYAVWTDTTGVFFKASSDSGGTFGSAIALSSSTTLIPARIAATGTDVYAIWTNSTGVFFKASSDSGGTFGSAITLSSSTTVSSAQIAATGTDVYAIWTNSTGVFFKASSDSGGTFGSAITLSSSTHVSAPQIAATGTDVYVVWTDTTSGNTAGEILFVASTNSGGAFGSQINLSSNAGNSQTAQIAATGTDVYVVWTDNTSGNNEILFVASTNSGGAFGSQINLSSNSGDSSSPSIFISGSNVGVTWSDNSVGNYEILFRISNDNGSTFGSSQNLSSNSGSSTSPTIGLVGTDVYVAWRDFTTLNSEILFEAGTISSINIAFDAAQYKLSQTAHITITDAAANHNAGAVETILVTLTSTSDSLTGISLTLTETGANTGVFTGQFTFTTSSSSGSSLKVSPGDTITATYSGQTANAFIFSRTVSFDFSNYRIGSKAIVTVDDQNSNLDPSTAETIQTTVTSTTSPTGISLTLTETGPNTGVFTNTALIFSSSGPFSIGNNVTASITNSSANLNPSAIDTVSITITSTTDPVGIMPTLSETGVNTGIFSGIFTLNTYTSSSGNNIHVTGGDVVKVEYQPGTLQNGISNLLVTPNPNLGLGSILANEGDIITATYQGVSSTSTIIASGVGGGGGGGLIRPGLVLDIAASLLGGGASYSSPPLLAFDRSAVENLQLPDDIRKNILNPNPFTPIQPLENTNLDLPFYINKKGFAISSYANTISTDVEQTFQPVQLKLNIHNYYEITHVGFYTNIPGASKEIYDSDTYIIYEKNSPLVIVDPHKLFSNITLATTKNDTEYSFLYNITFAKPMNKSDIIFRVWNDKKSSNDFKIFDAWQIVKSENEKNTQDTSTPSIFEQNTESKSQNENNGELLQDIKMWGGYLQQSISDSQFLSKMGMEGNHIPHWFMKSTKLVVDGDITQQDFVKSIKYLYDKGIIK